ncbi:MAG: hypothetical protein KGV43_01575 [Arcobacter sp.]|nr:hypothetical protein [Arcobacter sp.]
MIDNIFSSKTDIKDEYKKVRECLKKAPFIDDFEELKKYITSSTSLKGKPLEEALSYLVKGNKDEIDISNIYPLIKNYLGEIIK